MTKWWKSGLRWRGTTSFLVTTFLALFFNLAGSSSVNDCHSVKYAYLAKGLDLKDVPRQPRQGKGLSSPLIENRS